MHRSPISRPHKNSTSARNGNRNPSRRWQERSRFHSRATTIADISIEHGYIKVNFQSDALPKIEAVLEELALQSINGLERHTALALLHRIGKFKSEYLK